MGYYMVYWGAGVHQWQVTLDELFHQLFVSGYQPSPFTLTYIHSGQTPRKSSTVRSAS